MSREALQYARGKKAGRPLRQRVGRNGETGAAYRSRRLRGPDDPPRSRDSAEKTRGRGDSAEGAFRF